MGSINNIIFCAYRFSFNLIPDGLQAKQIVIDAFTCLVVDELQIELLRNKLLNHKSYDFLLMRSVFQNIYRIALKREKQLIDCLVIDSGSIFFTLSVSERASLHLRYQTDFSADDFEIILDKNRANIIVGLNSARARLWDNLGIEISNAKKSECHYQRSSLMAIDANFLNTSAKNILDHIRGCRPCQGDYAYLRKKDNCFKQSIPIKEITYTDLEEIISEYQEINKLLFQNSVRSKGNKLLEYGRSFFHNIFAIN